MDMPLIIRQKGMTLFSIMIIIVFFAFIAITAVKIIPIYLDSYTVSDVVSSLKDERGLGDKSNREIASLILKRLKLNQVSDVTEDDIYIEKAKNTVLIDVEYEARKPMYGNLDVIISFKHSVEAPAI